MEWVNEILEENEVENVDEIIESFKEKFPQYAVPKDEYNKKADKIEQLEAELEQTNEQLEQTSEQLDKLEKYSEENEELQEQLEQIKQEKEQFEQEKEQRIGEIQKKAKVEKDLLSSNVPEDAVDLLVNDFNFDELELDEEGNLKNYEEQKGKVRQKRSSLFGKEKVSGQEPVDGDTEETVIDVNSLDNMTAEQINDNWDKVKKVLENQ